MALAQYTDLPKLKLHCQGAKSGNTEGYDPLLITIIEAASRAIDLYTERYFGEFAPATTRKFKSYSGLLVVDDISDEDSIVIEDAAGNAITDFTPYPLNGVVSGLPGNPTNRIESCYFCKNEIYEVTATWGWPEVPALIQEMCLLLAADMYFAKDTVHGIKGSPEFGVVRIRENRQIESNLCRYAREGALIR